VTPEVSAVVVNYRTAAEATECVRSLRNAFQKESIPGEVVLVDCASGSDEIERLSRAGADALVALPENRGYSGGVNAGLARARGSLLVLSNADVVFEAGAVTALRHAASDPSVGAAAPLAVWDAEGRLRLPSGFPSGFFRDLAQVSAGRFPRLDRSRFAAFARRQLDLWERGGDTDHLIGVVLAARRAVFDRVGRLDERFEFEYEETEWEERVRRMGLRLRFVPTARVRHFWARSASAANPADTAARRAASLNRYRQSRYGSLGRALLERASASPRPPEAVRIPEPLLPSRPGAALAVTPNPSLIPFVGTSLEGGFRLADELAAGLPAGPLSLRAFDAASGRPLETFVWEKSP
jgi:N-acetylglucosaminyl-diphospho-decaprenol L-rhamnosyltransferase